MADLQYLVDYSSVKEANKELEQTGTTAKKSAAVFEAAFKKAEAQSKKQLTVLNQQMAASKRLEAQKTKELASEARAAREVSNSYAQLKASIDPVYAAQLRMRKAHETVRAALKAELITRTEAAQSLVEYRKQAKVFMQTQMAATKASNRFGVVTQQAGYQVGDFLVQVQSGTNPMVAFGQQATQLVGILPLMTGAFGLSATALIGLSAGLGIAIPLATAIGAALLKSGESSNSASEGIKKYESAVKSLREETEKLNDEIEVQLRGMNSLNELYVQKEIERLESKRVDLMSQMETLSGRNLRAAQLRLNALEGEIEANKQILSDNEAVREKSEKIKNIWVEIKSTIEDTSVGHLLTGFDQMYDKLVAMQETALRGEAVGRGRGLGRGGPTAEELIKNVPAVQLAYSIKDDDPVKPRPSSGGVAPKDPAKELEKFMAQQEQANALQKQGIMLGEESVRVTELINKYKEAGLPLDLQRIQNLAEEEQRLQTLQYAHDSLTNALMSVVDGTQSVGQAFKGLIVDMLLEIYRQQVAKNFASTALSLFGFANGGVFSNGSQVNAFADGGVVGGPTYFPMSGGQTGLMGEAGPEAIMPLKRGADGKLGVQMSGGGEQVVINQNINISTGVQQTVRNEIKSMMPQIAAQSKSAVLDAKRRGGSYGGKF